MRSPRVVAALVLLAAVLAATLLLTGCGASLRHAESEDASADVDQATPGSCGAAALGALGHVAVRVYREGIQSERVASARHMIEGSRVLREAVEVGDASAARAAGRALIATGHLTNLRITRAGKVLVELGGPALAPVDGTLSGKHRRPLARYVTSVWAAGGLVAETNGIAQGLTVIRASETPTDTRTIAGSFPLPASPLPTQGTLTREDVPYQFTSYAARSYPDGAPVRVYLLRALNSIEPLCGKDANDTAFNTIRRVAHLIYDGEAGRRTGPQIHRVQVNRALLQAVARRDPRATRGAVEALLHQHIVRLRVTGDDGRLLADVGGPYVLAPVQALLRLGGHTIGKFLLSIQDDEGYKRLANRLAGLDVLMYVGPRLVKSTVGFSPGPIPESGPVVLRGRSYRAYTFKATAFPAGPLRITVLIPLPYS
ncbi:MAG TPA: hypothetical protein VMB05_04525 [Solirubrobacteraceae bacterium]|nr:hypothetical protein [Solirubrobacteraceae bacterium]